MSAQRRVRRLVVRRLPVLAPFFAVRFSRRAVRYSARIAPDASNGLPSKEAIATVASSWTMASNDLEGNGVVMFRKIFEIAPEALDLFSFRAEHNVFQSPALRAHATKVMATVGVAVAGLTDLEKLVPLLKSLGRMHKEKGVLPAHYDVVGEALLYTIKTALGSDHFTEEVGAAWAATYHLVAHTMIQGAGYDGQK